MRVRIEKSIASGILDAPPSKSIAHRLLICAALSEGVSHIKNLEGSQDILATMDCLKSLGAKIKFEDNSAMVEGINISDIKDECELNCRESGSTLRFFIPIVLLTGKKATLYGSETLFQRPLTVYEEIFKKENIKYTKTNNSITLKGKINGGFYKLQGNISSQFISGLLFALPLVDKDTTINIIPPIESLSYINLTVQALKDFGISIQWKDERTLFIPGKQKYKANNIVTEGDYSNTAFFEAMNILGSSVDIRGLNEASIQGDKAYERYFPMIERGTPTINISDCPDLGPVLFALSGARSGGVFTGTRRLKIKESDRAAAMAEELDKFGISVRVMEDTVIVYPNEFHAPTGILNSHNDHRIVMALTVLLMLTGGEIEGAEAVNKSFPDFFSRLNNLGVKVTVYEDN